MASVPRLPHAELVSRMRLHCEREEGGDLAVPPEVCTLIRTLDCSLPEQVHSELEASLAGAKSAELRSGAELPSLVAAEQLTLLIEAHLQRWQRAAGAAGAVERSPPVSPPQPPPSAAERPDERSSLEIG